MYEKTKTAAKIAYITLGAMFGALLLVSQLALASLPNIELVSLLIIVWTRVYRAGALPGISVFIVLEGVLFGFGIWWVSYLYIWFLLWGAVMLIPRRFSAPARTHKITAAVFWAILSGVYGLAFGALTAIPWFFRGGLSTAIAYWSAGIPFDLSHAAGNFVAALLLAEPLTALLTRLKKHA